MSRGEKLRSRFVEKTLQAAELHPNRARCQNCRFLRSAIVLRVDAQSHRAIE